MTRKKLGSIPRRAAQRIEDYVDLMGKLVRYVPRHHKVDEYWILAVAVGMKYRFGYIDLALLPVAGGGLIWANVEKVQLHHRQEIDPVTLLEELDARLAVLDPPPKEHTHEHDPTPAAPLSGPAGAHPAPAGGVQPDGADLPPADD